jgi:UDP-glucose 4-epimerase
VVDKVRALSSVLITGAGGYVGGRLTEAFRDHGCRVRALVRDPTPWLEIEQHAVELSEESAADELAAALEGIDSVVHLAGEDEVTAAARPAAALAATVIATERVAEACAAAGTKRLVYLSTIHAYGARMAPGAILTEEMRPEPRSAYGISRLASEHVAASLANGSYELIVMRLTNSVGAPYDPAVNRWTLVANDLCRQGVVTGRLELRSSGMQWRDFVPMGDVCRALVAASDAEGRVLPGTYNLGSGHPMRVRDLAGLVQDAFEQETGQRPELRAPEPAGEPPLPYQVSVERAAARGLLLDSPLSEAITETVRFCREHQAALR